MTHQRIVESAVQLASRDGLSGLSIGGLAEELGLSKSGLFAHFGSKEALQLAVLESAAGRFGEQVIRPALAAPRGLPRVRALFERWLAWANDRSLPGGCVFIAAAAELDDQPGAAREFLVGTQKEWLATLAKAARIAVEEGHLAAELDTAQFAFEMYGIALAYHHGSRLLRDRRTEARAHAAFERLVESSKS
jgi:AcrR family transcriptional regulator